MYEITIIVPVFNCWTLTRELLQSLKTNTDLSKIEIIFFNNGSTDFTADGIHNFINTNAEAHVIAMGTNENLGYAEAVNRAAIKASGKYILLMHNDIIIKDNKFIEKFLDAVKSDTFKMAGLRGGILKTNANNKRWDIIKYVRDDSYNFLDSYCLLIDRKTFLSMKGFDNSFQYRTWEEVDFFLRFDKLSYAHTIVKNIDVVHQGGLTRNSQKTFNSGEIERINAEYIYDKFNGLVSDKVDIMNYNYKILLLLSDGQGNMIESGWLIKELKKRYRIVDVLLIKQNYNYSDLFIKEANQVWTEKNWNLLNEHEYVRKIETIWANANKIGNTKIREKVKCIKSLTTHQTTKNTVHNLDKKISEVQTAVDILNELNITNPTFEIDIPYELNTERFDICIAGGSKDFEYWNVIRYRYYKELVQILKDKGYKVVSVGRKEEYVEGTIDRTGLSLMQTAGVIKQSRLVIANECGLYHLSTALKVPNIVLWTNTRPNIAYDERLHRYTKVIMQEMDCRDTCQVTEGFLRCKHQKCRDNKPLNILVKEIEEYYKKIPKFVAVYSITNYEYIINSLKSIYEHVDKIVILISKKSWYKQDIFDKKIQDTIVTCEQFKKEYDSENKIFIEVNEWFDKEHNSNQTAQRTRGFDYMDIGDYYFLVDDDEIWEESKLIKTKEIIILDSLKNKDIKYYNVNLLTFFRDYETAGWWEKSPRFFKKDNSKTKFIKSNTVGYSHAQSIDLPKEIFYYHLGWVRKDVNEIQAKIDRLYEWQKRGHLTRPIVKDWMNKVFFNQDFEGIAHPLKGYTNTKVEKYKGFYPKYFPINYDLGLGTSLFNCSETGLDNLIDSCLKYLPKNIRIKWVFYDAGSKEQEYEASKKIIETKLKDKIEYEIYKQEKPSQWAGVTNDIIDKLKFNCEDILLVGYDIIFLHENWYNIIKKELKEKQAHIAGCKQYSDFNKQKIHFIGYNYNTRYKCYQHYNMNQQELDREKLPKYAFGIMGSFMFIDKQALYITEHINAVQYKHYFSDVDYSLRAWKLGIRSIISSVEVIHNHKPDRSINFASYKEYPPALNVQLLKEAEGSPIVFI